MARLVFKGRIAKAGFDASGRRYAIFIPVHLRKKVEELNLVNKEVIVIVEELN